MKNRGFENDRRRRALQPQSALDDEKTISLGHQLAQAARTRARSKALAIGLSTLLAVGAGGFWFNNYQGGTPRGKKGEPTLKLDRSKLAGSIKSIARNNKIPESEKEILLKFIENPTSERVDVIIKLIERHKLKDNSALGAALNEAGQ